MSLSYQPWRDDNVAVTREHTLSLESSINEKSRKETLNLKESRSGKILDMNTTESRSHELRQGKVRGSGVNHVTINARRAYVFDATG